MIVTNVCSVFSFKCQIIHKTATTNMLGNKLLLRITWVNSIFERFRHNLFITKTIPIYTNQTKCQNYLKCKCRRSRLHPIPAKAMNWFYAPSYKYLNQMIRIEELRVGNKVYFTEKQTEWEVSMLEENGVG